ncbi:MAG: hypothetical protein JW963_17585 [Anaerolineales bacterium]|nr:hypothetical protein [Anaerolineales bacterium]
MKKFLFWQRWLFVFSLIVTVFGMGMALLNRTSLFAVFDGQVDPVFWGASPLPAGVDRFQGWIYGVLGATMAGWGVFLAFIAQVPFRNRERWAWNALLLGLSLWYVTDTAISLYFGVIFNAVFNTAFFILALLPLLFTRQDFRKS